MQDIDCECRWTSGVYLTLVGVIFFFLLTFMWMLTVDEQDLKQFILNMIRILHIARFFHF